MRYVKIVSKSVTTVADMFTLGVSTSRGNADKIGQFGSGTLMGTLAWIRKYGKSPVFFLNGTRVTFKTQQVPKSDGVMFNQVLICHDGKRFPLSVALEYGELDWQTPDLGLREWISNAIDAGQEFNSIISIVDKMECSDDEVAIFVPYTDEAKEYADNLDRYFLHSSQKQEQTVIEKPALSPCRIYRKGVFVRELVDNSLFDYNMNFSINECRTGSSDSLIREISAHHAYYTSEKKIHRKIRDAVIMNVKCIEVTNDEYESMTPMAVEVWQELSGQIALCPDTFLQANCSVIISHWYKKIVDRIPELCGLDGVTEAELKGYTKVNPNEQETSLFNGLCDLIEAVDMAKGMTRPTLSMFNCAKQEDQPSFKGMYDSKKRHVMCWSKNTDQTRVMIHELCHHYTNGADDHSARFTNYAHLLMAAVYDQLIK